MRLTTAEIRTILASLRCEYGPGYSDMKEVSQLQAKLSMMLEVATKMEGDEIDEMSKEEPAYVENCGCDVEDDE